ncbi:MAG TPA: post-COAP-1 domain-containing protein, partial [Burkholderiales bacterium]|nr:post-COAP-1 domain-containing protein [Burkholderiales bacterium]
TDPVTAAITADIIVSSAHSDVNFVPAPKAGNAFMTGGGKLGTGRDIATFGFNAGSRDGGGLHGQLQYNDHAQSLKVHSLSIDSFGLIGTTCVTFSGGARVNNVDGYSFTVNQACDNGEPGVGHDTFDISVSGPGISYSRHGTLTGGNLQLHPE